MKYSKLSIVTSCYNAESFIERLYQSIIQQRYPQDKWEWVLVDDFSTDGTTEKIREISQRDPRIRVESVSKKKEAWWNPQRYATGEIVCPVDADDALLPGTFEKINYYFRKFPDAVLLHFNATKHQDSLPSEKSEFAKHYVNSVYISKENDSFLEGFQKLSPTRSSIFGYLRVFRNLPGLEFNHREENEFHSSNDAQWLLNMEEKGKWLSVPRTTYLARQHEDSENFKNWSIKGEVELVREAEERRERVVIESPRNIKYFDDIYEQAESTYVSELNWEHERKRISFINFKRSENALKKLKDLFFDHDCSIDLRDADYYYVRVGMHDTIKTVSEIYNSLGPGIVNWYFPNLHMTSNAAAIAEWLSKKRPCFWASQDNRKVMVQRVCRDWSLRIAHIDIGYGISVPPNGWGGLEEVMGQQVRALRDLGHRVDILSLNDFESKCFDYDVVHVHSAHFGLDMKRMGVPYFMTIHDVHPYLTGSDSELYKMNREAIEGSVVTFTSCEYYIDYFGPVASERMVSLDVGVNTDFWSPAWNQHKDFNAICVGSIDKRKNFALAVKCARKHNFPITIVGPIREESALDDIMSASEGWNGLTILGELDKVSLREELRGHSVLIHPSSIETGQPCLAPLEALSCGIPTVGFGESLAEEPGYILCNEETLESKILEIKRGFYLDNNESLVRDIRQRVVDHRNFRKLAIQLERAYLNNIETNSMSEQLYEIYKNTPIENFETREVPPEFEYNFIKGASVRVSEYMGRKYLIEFKNLSTGKIEYNTILGNQGWAKTAKQFYVDWEISVRDLLTGNLVDSHRIDLENRVVLIEIASKALGDTLAWIPYVEEFRKKHSCAIYCSVFIPELFEGQYPEINFIKPGTSVECYAQYTIGWHYTDGGRVDYTKNPEDFKLSALQRTSSSVLGLVHREIKPKINFLSGLNKERKVCIAIHGTCQAKYWNNPSGWQKVVDHLKTMQMSVVLLSREEDGYMGNAHPTGITQIGPNDGLREMVRELDSSELFIGIGSGISWLAWAAGTKTILISGFSEEHTEFLPDSRIINTTVCNSCFNRHRLDPGDWNWCPEHKGTDRMFECTKQISHSSVIAEINRLLDDSRFEAE